MSQVDQNQKYIILLHGLFEDKYDCFKIFKAKIKGLCVHHNVGIISPTMFAKDQLKGPQYTCQKLIQELQHTIDFKNPIELIVIGHSYGSVVMVELAKFLKSEYNLTKLMLVSINGCLGGLDLVHLMNYETYYPQLVALQNRYNTYTYKDWFYYPAWKNWWKDEQKFSHINSLLFWIPIHLINLKNGFLVKLVLNFFKHQYAKLFEVEKVMEDVAPQSEYLIKLHNWINDKHIPLLYISSDIEKDCLDTDSYNLYKIIRAYYVMLYNLTKVSWQKYISIQDLKLASKLVEDIMKNKKNFYVVVRFFYELAIYGPRSLYSWLKAPTIYIDAKHDGVLSVKTQCGGYHNPIKNNPFVSIKHFEGLYHNAPGASAFIPDFQEQHEKITVKNTKVHETLIHVIQKILVIY